MGNLKEKISIIKRIVAGIFAFTLLLPLTCTGLIACRFSSNFSKKCEIARKISQVPLLNSCLEKVYNFNQEQVQKIHDKIRPLFLHSESAKIINSFIKFSEGVKPITPKEKWEENQDALSCAKNSHFLLCENKTVRVLEVKVGAEQKEPYHTHKWASVMIIIKAGVEIRYFRNENDYDVFQSNVGAFQLAPEGIHAVENRGKKNFMPCVLR